MRIKSSQFKKLAETINIFDFEDYRTYFEMIYKALKTEEPQTTYQSFTEAVGLGNCNAMNLIVNGFRPLTVKTARKIADHLGLRGSHRKYLVTLAEAGKAKQSPDQTKAVGKLLELKQEVVPDEVSRELIEFFSRWYYPVVLETLRLEEASDQPEWLRDHIWPRLTLKQVNEAVSFLKSSGFIAYDKKRRREYPKENIATGRDVYGMAILHYHQLMLELAKKSLLGQDPMSRDITALTLSVTAEDYPDIRDEITAFREAIKKKYATDSGSQVLQLNIQLFPVAQTDNKGKASRLGADLL